jgi:transcription antitermination protein NusB
MGSRSTARRLAMQALFQSELSGDPIDVSLSNLIDDEKDLTDDSHKFAQHLAVSVMEKRPELDEMITKVSKNWSIDRLNNVDKAILRMAMYELKYEKNTPKAVVINEALELSKRYSDEESTSFINGILGAAVV